MICHQASYPRTLKLSENKIYNFNALNFCKNEKNSVMTLNFQIGPNQAIKRKVDDTQPPEGEGEEKGGDTSLRALIWWMNSYIHPKYFAEMRTKQQLGTQIPNLTLHFC